MTLLDRNYNPAILPAQGKYSIVDLDVTGATTGMVLAFNGTTVVWQLVQASDIADGIVTLAKLATGISPSHVVKFAGKHTTTGGAASEAFTVTGVASTDIVIATIQTIGLTPRTLLTTAPTTNTITMVFSGDPSTDHIVSYQVLRAAV